MWNDGGNGEKERAGDIFSLIFIFKVRYLSISYLLLPSTYHTRVVVLHLPYVVWPST